MKLFISKKRRLLLFFSCFCSLFIIFLTGCRQRELILTENNFFPYPNYKNGFISMQVLSQDNKYYLAAMDGNATVINLFDLQDTTAITVVPLDSIADTYKIYSRYFLAHSLDSIFVFADEQSLSEPECKQVFLINRKGNIIAHWNINMIYHPEIDRSSAPNRLSPVLYDKKKLYFHTLPENTSFFTLKDRKSAYSDPTELIVDISTNPATTTIKMGGFPEDYITNNYYDPFASRCINKKGQLIFSYGADHNLYVYEDNEFFKKIPSRSNYIKRFNPFDDKNKMDLYTVRKYFTEEPRYLEIWYDRYKDWYYRPVNHRLAQKKEDGTVHTAKDRKQSIIVLDSNLHMLGEIMLKQEYGFIYGITPEGIFMSNSGKGFSVVNIDFK